MVQDRKISVIVVYMSALPEKKIKLIIGLGNSGNVYGNTYHNIGHLFIDFYGQKTETGNPKKLLKSEGYMNNAGAFVARRVGKSGPRPKEIFFFQDYSSLEIGTKSISSGSGSAGHKGIASIIRFLKTESFWRLRIGIRPPKNSLFSKLRPRQKAGSFVLKKISRKNKDILMSVFEKAAKEIC